MVDLVGALPVCTVCVWLWHDMAGRENAQLTSWERDKQTLCFDYANPFQMINWQNYWALSILSTVNCSLLSSNRGFPIIEYAYD